MVPSVKDTSLSLALTTPVVTDCPYPRAFPMAITCSPTFRSSELPRTAILIVESVSSERSLAFTEITARSASESVPTIAASAVVPSEKPTVRAVAPSTT